MLAAASGRFAEDRQHRVVVQALRSVSFRLNPGDGPAADVMTHYMGRDPA